MSVGHVGFGGRFLFLFVVVLRDASRFGRCLFEVRFGHQVGCATRSQVIPVVDHVVEMLYTREGWLASCFPEVEDICDISAAASGERVVKATRRDMARGQLVRFTAEEVFYVIWHAWIGWLV